MRPRRRSGFTLVELVAVIGLLAIVSAMLVPIASQWRTAEMEANVRQELRNILAAEENYYWFNASFATTLTDSGFLGPYLNAGISNDAIRDDFNKGATYQSASSGPPYEVFSVWSVGKNFTSESAANGIAGDDLGVNCQAAAPPRRKTWMELDIIGAAWAKYMYDAGETSGTTTGTLASNTWTTDRANFLLLPEFDADGWGNTYRCYGPAVLDDNADTWIYPNIYSYGPDEADDSGTDDDVIF